MGIARTETNNHGQRSYAQVQAFHLHHKAQGCALIFFGNGFQCAFVVFVPFLHKLAYAQFHVAFPVAYVLFAPVLQVLHAGLSLDIEVRVVYFHHAFLLVVNNAGIPSDKVHVAVGHSFWCKGQHG